MRSKIPTAQFIQLRFKHSEGFRWAVSVAELTDRVSSISRGLKFKSSHEQLTGIEHFIVVDCSYEGRKVEKRLGMQVQF